MKRLIWKLKVWIGKSIRILLRWIFGFDKWHLFTLTEREYAKAIVTHCNSRKRRNSYAEIGCGLCDMVRNVKFKQRLGLDNDKNVLAAADFINTILGKKNITLRRFNFPQSEFEGKHDVIVMVNWIHHIEPSVLKHTMGTYFDFFLQEQGEMIIDTVQDPEYEFNHDISFLTNGLHCNLKKIGSYERQRIVWTIEKK